MTAKDIIGGWSESGETPIDVERLKEMSVFLVCEAVFCLLFGVAVMRYPCSAMNGKTMESGAKYIEAVDGTKRQETFRVFQNAGAKLAVISGSS